MWFRKHPRFPAMPDPSKHRDDNRMRLAALLLKSGTPITINRAEDGTVSIGTLPVPNTILPDVLRWMGVFLIDANALAQARQFEDERREHQKLEWERRRAAGEPMPEPMNVERVEALFAELQRGIDAMPPPKRGWWRR